VKHDDVSKAQNSKGQHNNFKIYQSLILSLVISTKLPIWQTLLEDPTLLGIIPEKKLKRLLIFLPNINRKQAAKRAEKNVVFVPADLNLQTRLNKG